MTRRRPSLSLGKMGARNAAARVPSQHLSMHAMGRHNNQKGAIGAKERQQKETKIK